MYIDLRDSVFEPSEPFLHAANLLQLLRKEGRAELREKERQQAALSHLATTGVLTYDETSDSIVLGAAE